MRSVLHDNSHLPTTTTSRQGPAKGDAAKHYLDLGLDPALLSIRDNPSGDKKRRHPYSIDNIDNIDNI